MERLRSLVGQSSVAGVDVVSCLRVLLNLAVVSFVLVSCGGSDDGGGTPPVAAPVTGVFIDSPVQGLQYSSYSGPMVPSGPSNLTGPDGAFLYRPGERVAFYVGGLLIGEALGQPQITPFTLLGRTSVPSVLHEGPVNIAQLLLGLDTVPGTETITLPTLFPVIPVTACISCASFDAEMGAAGFPIASEADAIAHLQKQFGIWGSWSTSITPSEVQVITFMFDGTFILAHDDDPLMAGGVDGMERGTYRWNGATNELTYVVAVNTDGTGGLSNPSASQTPPYTFVIDASGNNAVMHFGPNVSDQIAFTRVIDTTRLIVGAWKFSVPFDSGFYTVLTILPDGTFTVASDQADTDPAGMERGTYVYNATTATTGDVTFTTTVDTNGTFGVNDSPTLPATVTVHAEIGVALGGDYDYLGLSANPNEPVGFIRMRVP